jgi:hypothetical protein
MPSFFIDIKKIGSRGIPPHPADRLTRGVNHIQLFQNIKYNSVFNKAQFKSFFHQTISLFGKIPIFVERFYS